MEYKIIDLSKLVFQFIYEHPGIGCYSLNKDELILKSFEFQEKKFVLKFVKETDLNKYVFIQKAMIIDNSYYFQVENNELNLYFEKKHTLSNLIIEFYSL